MFCIVSLPLADTRAFLASETHRLAKPNFPTPIPDHEFVRNTGSVRSRHRGGSSAVGGEDVYCDARGSLRFLPSDSGRWTSPTGETTIRSVFRRLYHTGSAAFRYDVGFAGSAVQPPDATELAGFVANLQVRIPTSSTGPETLATCNGSLADHYLRSTTALTRGRVHPVSHSWCIPGDGMILLEHFLDERLEPQLPAFHQSIDTLAGEGISLRHVRLENVGSIHHLWVIEASDDADLRRVRQVRMHLTRVHTEYQCFRSILNAARTDPLRDEIDVESQRLERYLGTLSTVLDRDNRYGTPQKKILHTALSIAGDAQPGALPSALEAASSLKAELATRRKQMAQEKYRPQPWEKGIAYGMALAVVATVLYLVVRNEPIGDPNLVVLIRTLVSLAGGVLGAMIPGFLNISWKGKGWLIRAGGALAILVLFYLLTPTVLS